MARKESLSGKVVSEYLEKYPKLQKLTLAKKIYKEHPALFTSVHNVRNMINFRTGSCGEFNRKSKLDKSQFRPLRNDTDPFKFLPVSHADPFEPFEIKQGRVLIISDLHFPYQHNKAIESALKYGLKKKANCILINGDLIDFAGISRHEKDFRHRSVNEEFEAVRAFLKGLRELFPKARIIFKYGNHDERWEKWLFLKAPEIFDCSDFQLDVLLRLGELKIEVVKDKRPIKIGKLTVLHGHELAGGSGGVNPARGAFLKTFDSVLIGHFHKTSSNTEATINGDIISTQSTGCLCGMNPMYMPINRWNLGFAYVRHFLKSGNYNLRNLRIIKGKVY
jgi:predicted phosphodiesterase